MLCHVALDVFVSVLDIAFGWSSAIYGRFYNNLPKVNSKIKMCWVSLVSWRLEYHKESESILIGVCFNDFPFNPTYALFLKSRMLQVIRANL